MKNMRVKENYLRLVIRRSGIDSSAACTEERSIGMTTLKLSYCYKQ